MMIGYLLIHRVDTYQSQTELTLCTSSIHSRSKLYSIQHYVIKFVSDLSKVGGFSPVSSTNKIVHINLTEISLIVEFNILLQNLSVEFDSRAQQGVLNTTLRDKVCQCHCSLVVFYGFSVGRCSFIAFGVPNTRAVLWSLIVLRKSLKDWQYAKKTFSMKKKKKNLVLENLNFL